MELKPIQDPGPPNGTEHPGPNRANETLPYTEPPPARFAKHPAVTITGYALFAILVLVVGLFSGHAGMQIAGKSSGFGRENEQTLQNPTQPDTFWQ
jgi:hypothetical protein